MGNWLPPPVDVNGTLLLMLTPKNRHGYNYPMDKYSRRFYRIHTHDYGYDTLVVRCKNDLVEAWETTDSPVEFAQKHFGFDFEPHRQEEIEVIRIADNLFDIKVVEL